MTILLNENLTNLPKLVQIQVPADEEAVVALGLIRWKSGLAVAINENMAMALNHSQSDKRGVSYLSDKELLKVRSFFRSS